MLSAPIWPMWHIFSAAKFDETVEVSVRLGVDTRKADQNVRGGELLDEAHRRKRAVVRAPLDLGEKVL